MPVIIPQDLPASEQLTKENIFFLHELWAIRQDMRPLEIAIVNLGLSQLAWEKGLIRRLSNYPVQIKLELVTLQCQGKTDPDADHLWLFRRDFQDFLHNHYDGLIVTAPNKQGVSISASMQCQQEDLWRYCLKGEASVFCMGGAAMQALNFYHSLPVFPGEIINTPASCHICNSISELTRGFDDVFQVSTDGLIGLENALLEQNDALEVLVRADDGRICLIASNDRKFIFCRGENPRSAASLQGSYTQLLMMNWLNYYVYQAVTLNTFIK